MKSYQSKRFKKNKIQNPAISSLKEKLEPAAKKMPAQNAPDAEAADTTREQAADAAKSKAIIVGSFAILGFVFAFIANYGFFDMGRAVSAGIAGFVAGAALGFLPYFIASKA